MITAGDFKRALPSTVGRRVERNRFPASSPARRGLCAHQTRNVMTGAVIRRGFNPTDKMPRAIVGNQGRCSTSTTTAACTISWIWTPTSSFPSATIRWRTPIPFVKEGTSVTVKSSSRQRLQRGRAQPRRGLRSPIPGPAEGDTASNTYKPATLKPAIPCRYRCSSTPATTSVWTPAPADTWSAAEDAKGDQWQNLTDRAPICAALPEA